MHKRRFALAIFILVALASAFGGVLLVRKFDGSTRRPDPKRALPIQLIATTSWHETQPTFEMHSQPSQGVRDTALTSRVIADLPETAVAAGTTLHFVVAVPEWAVFDEAGKLYQGGDGVVLSAENPDLGIGLELNRLQLNPAARAEDRKWHHFEVKVPPCTARIALEALPGSDINSNNWFDRLWVGSRESLQFRRARFANLAGRRPLPSSCRNNADAADCAVARSSNCESGGPERPRRSSGSALRTGAH